MRGQSNVVVADDRRRAGYIDRCLCDGANAHRRDIRPGETRIAHGTRRQLAGQLVCTASRFIGVGRTAYATRASAATNLTLQYKDAADKKRWGLQEGRGTGDVVLSVSPPLNAW